MGTPNSSQNTAENPAARNHGRLVELAKAINKLALNRRLLEMMKQGKVASPRITNQALGLGGEKRSRTRKLSNKRSEKGAGRQGKHWSKILDTIELNLKHGRREERQLKEEYRQAKRHLYKEAEGSRTKERKYMRMVANITRATQSSWEKGMKKNNERITWWTEKKKREKKKSDPERERTEWVQKVARGRGKERRNIKIQVPIYGDLKFSEPELDALSLPPKHADYEKVRKDRSVHQHRVTQTKTRWGWRNLVYDVDGNIVEEQLLDKEGNPIVMMENENLEETEEERIEREVKEQNNKEIYTPETQTLDFGKLRPTEVKSNQRVLLPKPGNAMQEAELNCREVLTNKCIENYISAMARESSLTKSEREGMESLEKRIKAKEIVVYPTDKSGKLAVTSFESYYKQGIEHTRGDKEITWGDIKDIQGEIKAHIKSMNRIFNPGGNHHEKT